MREYTVVQWPQRLLLLSLIVVVVGLCGSGLEAASPDVFRFHGGRSDRAAASAVDAVGNWYVAGYVETADGTSSFAVVKHNVSGGVEWVGRYTGSIGGNGGAALAVAVDAGGNVYAAGYVYATGTSTSALDYLVVKFTSNGVQQWAQRYNGPGNYYDQARCIAVDAAGNVYVSGRSYGASFDFATLKITSTGTMAWVRRFDGPVANSDEEVVDMALDSNGNVIVMGRAGNASGAFGNDVVTLKYNAAGSVIAQTTFTETSQSEDIPYGMDVDGADNVVITGLTSASPSPEQPIVPFLVKYRADGQIDFAVQDAAAGGGAVVVDAAGNIYVAGSSSPVFATPSSAVSKFSSAGALQWTTPIPETSSMGVGLMRIVVDAGGTASVAGIAFDRSTSTRDFLTMRLTASGAIAWQHRFNGTGSGNDEVVGLLLDSLGHLLVSGTSWRGYLSSGGTAEDMVTLRLANGVVPANQKPSAPASLAPVSVIASQVTLRWEDRSSDENGFRIERCAGNGCTAFAPVGTVGGGATTFRDLTVAKNTKYSYRVLAFNDAGTSGASNTATVQTPKK